MNAEIGNKTVVCDRVVLVSRIRPELKPFIPIISVGIALLLESWEFPAFQREGAINTRIAITLDDRGYLFYLMRHSGRSAAEVIAAALTRAKNSKVRPHHTRRSVWRVNRKPDRGIEK